MEKKIIDYKIVEFKFYLPKDITDSIEDGWQPFGTPFFCTPFTYQAMVKYSNEAHP